MRKFRLIPVFVSIVILTVGFAAYAHNYTTTAQNGLKGPVHTVTMPAKTEQVGGMLYSSGPYTRYFDRDGYLTKHEEKNTTTKYKYDDKGRLVSEITTTPLYNEWDFYYDDKIIEEHYYYYHDNGRLWFTESHYNSWTKQMITTIEVYRGQLHGSIDFYPNGYIGACGYHKCDEQGRIIELYYENEVKETTYDEEGYPIEDRLVYYASRKMETKWIRKYYYLEWDDYGNWVTRQEYVWDEHCYDGLPRITETRRTITYY